MGFELSTHRIVNALKPCWCAAGGTLQGIEVIECKHLYLSIFWWSLHSRQASFPENLAFRLFNATTSHLAVK